MRNQEEGRILAEVIVPCVDQAYDFWLDDRTPFGELAAEMADAVHRMERGSWPLEYEVKRKPLLCSLKDEKLLPDRQSPWEYGMKSGVSLLLLL